MADFETAQVEDRSFAHENQELVEEFGSPIFDGTTWRFPVSEGEEPT